MKRKKRGGWIDISVGLESKMVCWPGDPSVKMHRVKSVKKGDSCHLTSLSLGAHSGTHMDAPFHFLSKGVGIDKMPLDASIGKACVIEIKDRKSIKPKELMTKRIRAGERILFKTINSSRCWKTNTFKKDFVHITKEAAEYLAKKEVRLVGIDYLSVGGYKMDGKETHLNLLRAGIWIIEGLDLSCAKEGFYELVCLPLKIIACDGAPARAILRPLKSQ